MSTKTPNPPESPCTSKELLDYLEPMRGVQVEVYKRLCGGIARSSYSIYYMGGNGWFDCYSHIGNGWETMKRKLFYSYHGETERVWHFYNDEKP